MPIYYITNYDLGQKKEAYISILTHLSNNRSLWWKWLTCKQKWLVIIGLHFIHISHDTNYTYNLPILKWNLSTLIEWN